MIQHQISSQFLSIKKAIELTENGKLLLSPESIAKIRHREGTARLLANSQFTEDEIIESLYLGCFSRFPNEQEVQLMRTAFSDLGVERKEAVEDIVWALLNSREFVFNH